MKEKQIQKISSVSMGITLGYGRKVSNEDQEQSLLMHYRAVPPCPSVPLLVICFVENSVLLLTNGFIVAIIEKEGISNNKQSKWKR